MILKSMKADASGSEATMPCRSILGSLESTGFKSLYFCPGSANNYYLHGDSIKKNLNYNFGKHVELINPSVCRSSCADTSRPRQ